MQHQRPRGRSLWLWRTRQVISDGPDALEQFASFAEHNGVRRAFVHVDPDLSVADFEALVSRCATGGIDVEALMGDPGWVLNPRHESFTDRLVWVAAYQARHEGNPAMQIRGLHLDIEVRNKFWAPCFLFMPLRDEVLCWSTQYTDMRDN